MPHTHHLSDNDVNVTSSGDHHHHVDAHDDGVWEERDDAGVSVDVMVWKGLIVLAGIYVFFVAERLISLGRTLRRRSNKAP